MIKNPKKILLLRNDRIGDLVLSSGIFPMVKKLYPRARIDMVVSPENKAIVEGNNKINKLYVIKYAPRKIKEFLNYISLARQIRKERYDLGIELRGSLFNTIILMYFGGIKHRIGLYRNWLAKLFLNHSRYKDYTIHCTTKIVDLVNKGLNANFKSVWPEIKTNNEDKQQINQFFKEKNISKIICLCVDSNNDVKQWPMEKFDYIIKYISKKYPNYKIALVGVDKDKIEHLMEKNPKCIRIFKKNLRFIYLLFKKSALVIGPDGGTMHLAWVSKTHTITLVPDAFRPYIRDNRPIGKNSIMIFRHFKDISTDMVKKLVDKILLQYE